MASFLLLMATCAAILCQSGLAQLLQPPPLGILPSLPQPSFPFPWSGFFPPGTTELLDCWIALFNVPGCAEEINRSVLAGQIGKAAIGPVCCKAFASVEDKCTTKTFPLLPLFTSQLKNECARIAGPPTPAAAH